MIECVLDGIADVEQRDGVIAVRGAAGESLQYRFGAQPQYATLQQLAPGIDALRSCLGLLLNAAVMERRLPVEGNLPDRCGDLDCAASEVMVRQ